MKTNPVAQIISVITSRPGGPPPGSPKNLRGFSVVVVPCQSPATARTRALPRTARQKSKQNPAHPSRLHGEKILKSQPLRTNTQKFPSKFFPKILPTAL